MKKPELTKEESEIYFRIVTTGHMDDMFDFAYTLGVINTLKEQLKKMEKSREVSPIEPQNENMVNNTRE